MFVHYFNTSDKTFTHFGNVVYNWKLPCGPNPWGSISLHGFLRNNIIDIGLHIVNQHGHQYRYSYYPDKCFEDIAGIDRLSQSPDVIHIDALNYLRPTGIKNIRITCHSEDIDERVAEVSGPPPATRYIILRPTFKSNKFRGHWKTREDCIEVLSRKIDQNRMEQMFTTSVNYLFFVFQRKEPHCRPIAVFSENTGMLPCIFYYDYVDDDMSWRLYIINLSNPFVRDFKSFQKHIRNEVGEVENVCRKFKIIIVGPEKELRNWDRDPDGIFYIPPNFEDHIFY
jgi:hypothetical protein